MARSLPTGVGFGTTSGVITTLGLMVGLHSGTRSRLAVLGGILTIAIADALSDALGMHISEEARRAPLREVWAATLMTFVTKFVIALSFSVPVVMLELNTAMLVSIGWGALILAALSYWIAKSQGARPGAVMGEHLAIALAVVLVTHFVGVWINAAFSE